MNSLIEMANVAKEMWNEYLAASSVSSATWEAMRSMPTAARKELVQVMLASMERERRAVHAEFESERWRKKAKKYKRQRGWRR